MARTVATLTGGILLGVMAMLAAGRFETSSSQAPDEIVRDIADVPKISQAAAEKHRSEQYAGLTRVEEIVALPTEFARSSALYALAGRSDSAGVQALIFEASRIADDVERAGFLNILFFRLAESDAPSALALARTEPFGAIKSIEQTVWRAWARNDLEAALFAAKTQTSWAHSNSAAQSLYAAFGYLGNETTDRIEAETGIGPSRSTRARYLYQLADKSPAEAIEYINELEQGVEQQEHVYWLATYMSQRDPTEGLRYANRFRVAADSERYRSIINGNIARENPQATIDRLLASGQRSRSRGELHSAVRALASKDLDAAKQYFEQAQSSDDRRMFGSAIATALASTDPIEAMRWARANEYSQPPVLQMSVLAQIARTEPELALAEALESPNLQLRSNMVSTVVQQIAHVDPIQAAALLDRIEERNTKRDASRQLASMWIQQDPEAAIEWILGHELEVAQRMMRMAGYRLVRSNVDAAIRMLPRLDAMTQAGLSQQIAQTLAVDRSAGEAQAFIRQFEGQPSYDKLQASIVAGIAQSDVMMAKQLADQLVQGTARDNAYAQLITQHAQVDAAQAARWLTNISNERLRDSAAGQLASNWYRHDPAEAMRWVSGLPAGSMRDDAIVQMSSQWLDDSVAQSRLIASIDDRSKRSRAKVLRINAVMRSDPARARKLLEDQDIPADQRQNIETMIDRYAMRF